MFDLKTAETFQSEIKTYINTHDSTILEAILAYGERYGLDEDYIKKHLLTSGLKEQLKEECESLNLIKKDTENKFDI